MLLDSNILIYGADGGYPALDEILDRTDLAVASVTCIETLGFHLLSEAERNWLQAAVSCMRTLALDSTITARAIHLRQQKKMGLADAIIAATALEHGLPLVTRNVADFQHIPDLQIINPF